MSEARLSADRLLRRLAELAAVGDTGDGGCSRLALTDDDRRGRDLVAGWMRDLGLIVTIDAIGNVVGTQPGFDDGVAPVMCGSHIDTVATGGRYDGNYGVLAGLEVIEAVQTAGVALPRPLAVAFFTNEEGSRFAPDMLGSLAFVGGIAVEAAHDIVGIDGARVRNELARIGYLGGAPLPAAAPHAFVELHIEQGPILAAEGTAIGAVTGVQGISWREFTVTGQSNHAGTTPMRLRRDPLLVAAEAAVAVRRIVAEIGDPQVGTIGRIDLDPNLVNVVARSATFTVDLRNTDDALLRSAEARVAEAIEYLAAAEGATVTSRPLARFEPVAFDETVVCLVETVARERGLTVRRMPSGAGHDAQMLARVCPTAMVFVPSVDGISHNPAEHTAPADLTAGAEVLAEVMIRLART